MGKRKDLSWQLRKFWRSLFRHVKYEEVGGNSAWIDDHIVRNDDAERPIFAPRVFHSGRKETCQLCARTGRDTAEFRNKVSPRGEVVFTSTAIAALAIVAFLTTR